MHSDTIPGQAITGHGCGQSGEVGGGGGQGQSGEMSGSLRISRAV